MIPVSPKPQQEKHRRITTEKSCLVQSFSPMPKALYLLFFLAVLSLFFHPSLSTTFLVDGVNVWNNPIVHVGDSVIFRNRYGYDLYIFRSKDAFNVCNFAQATILTKPNSTSYMWYPSRPGFYYFAFSNGSFTTCPQPPQKLSVQVTTTTTTSTPAPAPAPPATSPGPISGGGGGMVSSSPSYPWPSQPREGFYDAPGPSPAESTTVNVPEEGGAPFINSNPAVPLPTGEVDSATINPLPTTANAHQVMVGLLASQMALLSLALLLL